jgi:hypothetical protein
MRRLIAVALTLLLTLVPLSGCKERTVTVMTGDIVLCTAGEIIEDNTESLEVSGDDAADYVVTTTVVTCDRHLSLDDLYASAQDAITAGDLTAAAERLRTLLARDPNYGDAASQLADIDAGKKPTPGTGGGTASTPATSTGGGTTPGDETPTGPVLNLAKWVPDAIPGYSAQGIIADPATLFRQYNPQSGSSDQLWIKAEQKASDANAKTALDEFKSTYSSAASSTTINGKSVAFGVRTEFAAAAFTDGPVIVVVELHAKSGAASALKDAVLAVVTALTK